MCINTPAHFEVLMRDAAEIDLRKIVVEAVTDATQGESSDDDSTLSSLQHFSWASVDTASGSSKEKKTKSVSFGFCEVRNYPVILGDNPAISSGPPLTLGWEYEQLEYDGSKQIPLDFFEAKRNRRRRSGHDLVLGAVTRRIILKRSALVTDEEIREIMQMVNQAKKHRMTTVKKLQNEEKRITAVKRISAVFTQWSKSK